MRYHTKITLEINENQRKFTNQRITKNKKQTKNLWTLTPPGAGKAAHPLPPPWPGIPVFVYALYSLYYYYSINYFLLLSFIISLSF